jgi:hypothetical protein
MSIKSFIKWLFLQAVVVAFVLYNFIEVFKVGINKKDLLEGTHNYCYITFWFHILYIIFGCILASACIIYRLIDEAQILKTEADKLNELKIND